MDSDMSLVIEQILQNSFFRMSIRQQLQKIVQTNTQKNPLSTQTNYLLVQEIMGYINTMINSKIKQILDEEYIILANNSIKITNQLQSIKNRIQNIQTKQNNNQIKSIKYNLNPLDNSYFQHLQCQNQSSILGRSNFNINNSRVFHPPPGSKQNLKYQNNSLKFIKLKQQVQQIKLSLQKYSLKQIYKYITQLTQQINNKLNNKYQKLCIQIQNTSITNRSFNLNQINDSNKNKYQIKIEYLTEKINNFQVLMEERYQSNFKNVWNVITDLEGTLSKMRKNQQEKIALKEKENEEKKGLSGFFKWKS